MVIWASRLKDNKENKVQQADTYRHELQIGQRLVVIAPMPSSLDPLRDRVNTPPMKKVSVVIPTHNRPSLLREAVNSVIGQTYSNWEIVIVDDGSQPPVCKDALQQDFGSRIRVLRNDEPLMQPYARDQGVKAASGEIVIHLDDDDLLAPDVLEKGLTALEDDPSLELVFLDVRGFGKHATEFETSQGRSMKHVLDQIEPDTAKTGVLRFGPELFGALLTSVPMAFQRSIEYRATWNKVSALRRRAYSLGFDRVDDDRVMRQLRPPLRESEWAIYAAACCKTALLMEPLYLQRCEKQGYFSIDEQRESAAQSAIDIKRQLLYAAEEIAEFKTWAAAIRKSLSKAYLDQSHFYFRNEQRLKAYKALINASRVRPAATQLRFALRMLLSKNCA
jgi:GT2 family glycosyltransferase